MTKRHKGDGSIYQRANGTWVGVIDLGNVAGKRVRKTVTARTLRELRPKFRTLQATLEQGVIPDNVTVEQWMHHWLDTIAPQRVRPRPLATYRGYVDNWIVPSLGAHRLDKLRPEHVRAMHATMRQAGKSTATIRQAHAILQRALRVAVMERRLLFNAAELVERPPVPENHHGPLMAEDARLVLETLAARMDSGDSVSASRFLVALLAGLRQGEALGLRWKDVDLTPGHEAIMVTQAIQRQKGSGLVEVPPKSRTSIRTVPLMLPVAAALREHAKAGAKGYVWGGAKPIDPRRDWGNWRELLAAAGCSRNYPLHSARATTASLLASAGVPLKAVADILGHADFDVTWKSYVATDDRQLREGIEAGWLALSRSASAPAVMVTSPPPPTSPSPTA